MKQSQYVTQIAQPAYNALVAEHGGKGSAAWKEKAKELIAEHEEHKASSYKGFKTNDQDQVLAMKQLMTGWKKDAVMTGYARDGIGPEASRLRLSHWAGPSVTRSSKLSQSFYRGIIIVILTKGKPVPLAWEFIYKLGELTRVTSTILPYMGRKCVTEA